MNNYCNFRYVLYKLPKVSQSSNPVIRNGLAYLYMTNKTIDKGWQLSAKKISDENSIPGNTLAPLYNDVRENKSYHIRTFIILHIIYVHILYLTDSLFSDLFIK